MELQQRFECRVESIVFGGDGLTHGPDGSVVFLAGALPQEHLLAEVTEVRKNYARARILQWESHSPHRITPACPLSGRCAGCRYAHMDYALELAGKNAQLAEKLHCTPESPFGAPEQEFYRNKLVLHVKKAGQRCELGFVENDNVSLCDVEQCRLARPEINEALAQFRSSPGAFHTLRDGMKLQFRFESSSGKVHMFRNTPDPHASYLKETLPFGPFSVVLGDFFQVNLSVASALAEEFGQLCAGVNRCFDLYCGAGFFSCAAAHAGVREVIGVEQSLPAVQAASFNLRRFPEVKAHFEAGNAAKKLHFLLRDAAPDDLAVVDPPRSGMSGAALNAIGASKLKQLVYISCNAATLARDAAVLQKAGFSLQSAQLFDMFPRTAHFETLARFSR